MKILIIEDDNNKSKHLRDFLNDEFPDFTLTIKRSYQTGLKEILSRSNDIIILDMSLPTYETSLDETGYKFRPFGGKEILSEMKRKKIICPTIVFTQFDSFGEGNSYTGLNELKSDLKVQFPDSYIDSIYYSASESLWKNELEEILNTLKEQ